MGNLPFYIPAFFILTTGLTGWFFYRATNRSRVALIIALLFLVIQMALALTGFFAVTHTVPPRLVLQAPPVVLFIISFFFFTKGKQFLDSLNLKFLTLLHIVRVPVELVLYWLFLYKGVPELMTFEGRNFDIISGLTAPLVYYFAFVKKSLSPKVILIWNFVCLGLLFNIVINAILSAPTPIQQFAFDQPNIAILYFPFVWLAGFIVPVVLLAHLAAIRQLLSGKDLDLKN
ncbi:hypothetical protein I5M27_14800 [Adhaeribacter sp. BT258]|uniref:Uncharacterized protein n=1 Tax=Adhaeribacter terrigena TaxID=2793070 RepID=A0ABS1C4E2_9BACT|nr:hypothetical protein [Adhaeribacter terrigena]MBK0404263.1 hypothetical protein [Adhaeribacter terrigena]